jgi:alpha-tubulin suppressor-like RCC1 family protein
MPINFRKGTFGTGGPTRVRPYPMSATPRLAAGGGGGGGGGATGGKLWTWGAGGGGALGLGNATTYYSPKQVGALTTWVSFFAGEDTAAAIKTDGTLWTWGRNTYGQLGLGTSSNASTFSPTQVGTLTDWSKIATNGTLTPHTGAIKTDGTMWAWGRGSNGQLGLGNTTNRSSPVQVGALTNWSKISKSILGASAAIKTDGTLWTWGENIHGQLGLGNTTDRSSPVQVGALTNWADVVFGNTHTAAIKTDGTLWTWGTNFFGQLGLGNTTSYSSPMQVGSLTNWLQVSAGGSHTLAIKTNGSLWAWGYNDGYNDGYGVTKTGVLGLGTTNTYSSPVQVGALTNWLQVATGRYHTLALKTNGTLWAWGGNYSGGLGTGNTTYYSSPIQVGALTTWISIPEKTAGFLWSGAIST